MKEIEVRTWFRPRFITTIINVFQSDVKFLSFTHLLSFIATRYPFQIFLNIHFRLFVQDPWHFYHIKMNLFDRLCMSR